ncbi:MAG: D-aminoacyl-tRNA deacylase [Muribaculaceae bacterium]
MRIVIQRVKRASVTINNQLHSKIDAGLMILVGVTDGDLAEEADWLAGKVASLRIFNDESGVMNLSITDIGGEVLAVSQFTLSASTRKGNRPSYIHAAKHELAIPLYERFCQRVSELIGKNVETGVFGADMQVELINDGPVTIIIDSHLKE